MKPTEMLGEQLFARIFCLGLLMVCFGIARGIFWYFGGLRASNISCGGFLVVLAFTTVHDTCIYLRIDTSPSIICLYLQLFDMLTAYVILGWYLICGFRLQSSYSPENRQAHFRYTALLSQITYY